MDNQLDTRKAVSQLIGDLVIANTELTVEVQRLRALVEQLQKDTKTGE